jgi:MFS family permease
VNDRVVPHAAGPGAPPAPVAARIWTPTFLLLCGAALLAASNQGLLTPGVPLYVHALGGSAAVIGVILAIFSVTSVGVRPFIGYWTDRWSLLGVMTLGALVLGFTGFLFLLPVIPLIAVTSFVRGFAWAAFNTAAYTLLAHLAPPTRRAEASGGLGLFQGTGHALPPALSVWLVGQPWAGFGAVFLLSGALGLAATAFARGIRWEREPAPSRESEAVEDGGPAGIAALYDRGVLLAAALLGCITLTHPASSAFLPLFALERGLTHVDWYYIVGAVTGISMNVVAGRVSDQAGRGIILVAGFSACIAGLFLVLIAHGDALLIAGGALYGAGGTFVTVSSMAVAIERADPRRRGAAMATYSAAYSTGQGIGALLSGVIADLAGYSAIYVAALGTLAVGLALTAANWRTLRRGKHA